MFVSTVLYLNMQHWCVRNVPYTSILHSPYVTVSGIAYVLRICHNHSYNQSIHVSNIRELIYETASATLTTTEKTKN